jgi:hypothetical protein
MDYPISRININKNTKQLMLKTKPNENLELYKQVHSNIQMTNPLTEFNGI